MSRRRFVTVALIACATCGISACGVDAQSQPRAINRADVPFDLDRRSPDTPTTTDASDTASYTIFLVADDRLQAVARSARNQPGLVERLTQLTKGPTAAEADAGLRTLLPPEVTVDAVRIADGVATVELSGVGAAQSAGDERALAIAQLVYSVTAVPGVDRVQFEVDGDPAEVPRGDGRLTSRPVTRDDYALAAP
ncbi:MAG TPA: GerMN domain-containing protein [Acidimicrobiia bacterium]